MWIINNLSTRQASERALNISSSSDRSVFSFSRLEPSWFRLKKLVYHFSSLLTWEGQSLHYLLFIIKLNKKKSGQYIEDDVPQHSRNSESCAALLSFVLAQNVFKRYCYLLPLSPRWCRLSVTTDSPVAKDTRDMVTP